MNEKHAQTFEISAWTLAFGVIMGGLVALVWVSPLVFGLDRELPRLFEASAIQIFFSVAFPISALIWAATPLIVCAFIMTSRHRAAERTLLISTVAIAIIAISAVGPLALSEDTDPEPQPTATLD